MSLAGSTTTSYAGVTKPPTLTPETSGICSIAGTMRPLATSESCAAVSFDELSEIVTTTAWEGSRIATVGGCRSVGRLCSAWVSAFCVLTRSVFWSEVM